MAKTGLKLGASFTHFEPIFMVRQGQVLVDFAAMVSRPASAVIHAKWVLIGFLDPMTKQHTAFR